MENPAATPGFFCIGRAVGQNDGSRVATTRWNGADDLDVLRRRDPEFWNDHAPPYFPALYGEHEAVVSIETFRVLRGSLPRRALALVLEWAQDHRVELIDNWERCRSLEMPTKIEPLQ